MKEGLKQRLKLDRRCFKVVVRFSTFLLSSKMSSLCYICNFISLFDGVGLHVEFPDDYLTLIHCSTEMQALRSKI